MLFRSREKAALDTRSNEASDPREEDSSYEERNAGSDLTNGGSSDEGGKAASDLKENDSSDEESNAASVFTKGFTESSVSSQSTMESRAGIHQLVLLFHQDEVLKPLYFIAASKDSAIINTELETTLQRLLKDFARDLRIEAKTPVHSVIVSLVARRARQLASRITAEDFPETAKRSIAQLNNQPLDHGKRLLLNQFLEDYAPHPTDSQVSDAESSEDEQNELATLDRVIEFVKSSDALERLRGSFKSFVEGSLNTWEGLNHLWKNELGQVLPRGLRLTAKENIYFLTHDPLTIQDRVKRRFEAYSGEEWDWWPFRPARRPLTSGNVRLQWTCVSVLLQVLRYHTNYDQQCGRVRSVDISQGLASRVKRLVDHQKSSAPMPLTSVTAGPSTSATSQGGPRFSSSQTSPPARGTSSKARSTLQQSAITPGNSGTCEERHGDSAISAGPVTKDSYVLLYAVRGDRLHHTQIEVAKSWDDDTFFAKFRAEYKRLRGFWRYWLHPPQFAFCLLPLSFLLLNRISKLFIQRCPKHHHASEDDSHRYRSSLQVARMFLEPPAPESKTP